MVKPPIFLVKCSPLQKLVQEASRHATAQLPIAEEHGTPDPWGFMIYPWAYDGNMIGNPMKPMIYLDLSPKNEDRPP